MQKYRLISIGGYAHDERKPASHGAIAFQQKSGTGGRRHQWEGRMAGQFEPATEIAPGALQ
ncbi:hypothetical protein [Mesorhizobium hawassense]|uniref:hypothetical protein n=1 Tax=Mesorhizobium hawassense TaxID=1209954 RepID=UPI00142DA8B1|nr:hypothetical protein [Mesorhizobium hawassense]